MKTSSVISGFGPLPGRSEEELALTFVKVLMVGFSKVMTSI